MKDKLLRTFFQGCFRKLCCSCKCLISVPGCSLSAGRAVSHLALCTRCVSPVPLLPQDKEGFGSDISHEENVIFIFEESRTLHSNQLSMMKRNKYDPKTTIFKKAIFNDKAHLIDCIDNPWKSENPFPFLGRTAKSHRRTSCVSRQPVFPQECRSFSLPFQQRYLKEPMMKKTLIRIAQIRAFFI
ncbi:hypothetical protein [Bacillus sp. NEB1478]|uniref:hypothetical protein n=1 Tax=Bacillus sp. NEB1478 TaxID=3073816 RepID=UPI002873E11F|nr:hypothetical protein [Bacillus sp. NEB1478]WNB92343.1 hypothetical protein RGB74_01380 [Bacillus sp. NEB1478]